MKLPTYKMIGIALCVAAAAVLGWNTLPTSADDGACPLKAANAGTCPSAKTASLAKAEAGSCCADKTAKLSSGACCMDDAKQTAAKAGDCCEADAAKDVAALVMSDSRFTTLALAVKAAGMTDEFKCPSQKTVLAPTNEAFQKIPAEQWAALLEDDAKLKALLANHIIKDAAMPSCALKEAKTAKSAVGNEFSVSTCPVSGKVSVNNATIVGDALVASNGVVHAIDTVLMPEAQLAKTEAESIQVAAAKQ